MNKEQIEKLTEYAKERAEEVEDIDFQELMQLVIDGALWVIKNIEQ